MVDEVVLALPSAAVEWENKQKWFTVNRDRDNKGGRHLAAEITKDASKQTYATVRLLVDRDRIPDAFRAYAYFRWVDDKLDEGSWSRSERLAFINRQQELVDRFRQGDRAEGLTAQEKMLAELIRNNPAADSGLHNYIRSMMSVMAFDAERKGRLISQEELVEYARNLAVAVTEALHYFIGQDGYSPQSEHRYLAATGAHITHMLRDTWDDVSAGYLNIPGEFLASREITPADLASEGYRDWVRQRVNLARDYFAAGKQYLSQVESLRCRIAGFAYIGRFEGVLDEIERDGYQLRPSYNTGKSWGAGLRMAWKSLMMGIRCGRREATAQPISVAF